jgi:uncharacterized protein with von Willebrand factor type A (vWA) domain
VFIDFFLGLRQAGIAVSVREFLTLLQLLASTAAPHSVETFYYLCRMTLVKDETRFDIFDRVFSTYYQHIQAQLQQLTDIDPDWLKKDISRLFTDAEKNVLEELDLDTLSTRLTTLLKEQTERHVGGNKWIGTAGTSPFGNSGYHPGGIRIGGKSEHNRAVKVWEQRLYQDYDTNKILEERHIPMALRRLRRLARTGLAEELDLDNTIAATAKNAGHLDVRLRAPRKNDLHILMLFDVGGSMDEHIAYTEQLFTAARNTFKHMDFYYFHNCVYDHVWKHNTRRLHERVATRDILRTYSPATRLIFVGDGKMSPYEILSVGGAIDVDNEESGAVWLQRYLQQFPHYAWLNPEPQRYWQFSQSIAVLQGLLAQRMYPLTLDGLDDAMRVLSR